MVMENKELLTVSEYAKIKGISKQAVYKRLNNQLQPFLIVVESRKYIHINALSPEEQARLSAVEQPVEQQLNNHFQPSANLLEQQLAEKDSTIASLLRQIENLQEQNGKLTELLSNSQFLLAAEKQEKQKMLLEQETETTKQKKGIFGIFRKKETKSL